MSPGTKEERLLPDDAADQVQAIHDLLIDARDSLEQITEEEHGGSAYMRSRNARIQINEALRRVQHLQGKADSYPNAPE
jgi:hypothetical protein